MSVIKISCLPVAGKENPYQSLMIIGLNSSAQIRAKNGINDKFLGILRTAFIQKPDYIHFDWETSYYWRKYLFLTYLSIPVFLLQVLLVKWIFKVKLIWTPHNITPHDSSHAYLHRIVRRFFASQMTTIRMFSERSLQRASVEFKVDKERLVAIAEGDYTSYYKGEATKAESIQKLNLPNGKVILLYLGYIKPYKGLDHLIDAFYKELDEEYHLVLAGKVMDKDFYEKIKLKIKQRITVFNEFIPDDEVHYFYNAADVVVLPFNKVENSGSAILAMGYGKAIIAPEQGVLPERLQQQKELLYQGSIYMGLVKLREMSLDTIHRIGLKNKEALLKHKWEDFVRIFITNNK